MWPGHHHHHHRQDGSSAALRRKDNPVSRDPSWSRSDWEEEVKVVNASPPVTAVDRGQDASSPERRGLSPLGRDSVVFPHARELLSPPGPGQGQARLSAAESRRGSSTSPAHSERTSSGCGSPSDVSEGSPPGQQPRHPGDVAWGQPASPFLPPGLSAHPHPQLAPLGLHYMPSMHLPPSLSKPLSDLPLPFPYSKSLSEGLDSAFASPRPPFIHPAAAAAYYSSLRTSLPFPFPLPSLPVDMVTKTSPAARGEGGQKAAERLEVLRALRTGSADPLSKYRASPPSLQPPRLSPAAASAILSPRTSPATPGLPEGVSGRPADLKDLSRTLTGPSAAGSLAVDGRGLKPRPKEREPVRYQCEACSKSYSTFSGLSKHKQFHCTAQLKKEFSCKHCDKTYVSLGALKMHIRTHTLPCKCTVCGKAFSRPWLLQGHVRTHTGEKPFSCPHCARAFADRSNLRAHLQTHSDVKKYSCRHCSKTFSRMSLLLKHEDSCCSNAL